MNSKNILITGASGVIGKRLTKMLKAKGHQVSHLGRRREEDSIRSFVWDIGHQAMDVRALNGIDTIIHLAGASVAEKRWTAKRRKEILESRTESTRLLYDTLKREKHNVTTFIGASAIGYYGFDSDEHVFTEEDKAGKGFLAEVTRAWEAEEDKLGELMRLAKIRIGIVLSEKGGTLEAMAKPIKLYVGAPLGSGDQYVSWIHIDDVCGIIIKAVEDQSVHGAYNATSREPVTNRELTNAIAKLLDKTVWLPAVPSFALKLVLGEMADIVVTGNKVSSEKIRRAGYEFQFDDLDAALRNLYKIK